MPKHSREEVMDGFRVFSGGGDGCGGGKDPIRKSLWKKGLNQQENVLLPTGWSWLDGHEHQCETLT